TQALTSHHRLLPASPTFFSFKQKTAYEIGHPRNNPTDRHVHARAIASRRDRVAQPFGHPVQHLELDIRDLPPGIAGLDHSLGDRARVMAANGGPKVWSCS